MDTIETDLFRSAENSVERDVFTIQSVMADSLISTEIHIVQRLAGHERIFKPSKTKAQFASGSPGFGYFHGPVGDDSIYQSVKGKTAYVTHDLTGE